MSFSQESEIVHIGDADRRRRTRLRQGRIGLRRRRAQQQLDRRLARWETRRWRHWHEQVDQSPRVIG